MSSAQLIFPVAAKGSKTTKFDVVVVRYEVGYQYFLSSATVRGQKHSYPIRVKEKDISLVIQCRSQDEYAAIRNTIVASQEQTLKATEKSLVRFSYPALKLDYLGFIPQTSKGIRRFEYAPQLNLIFSPVKDTINQITHNYSAANGTWQDIYGNDPVDFSGIFDAADSILKNILKAGPTYTPIVRGGNRAV